ncbi:cytochrome P450 [Bisporella sp. PMI_857]|nr:cytochrome P450 [Bisporella sp. PMI_857]
MYGLIFAAITVFSCFCYGVIYPVAYYFYDPKGLRKYPNLNLLSGITDFSFIWEANQPFRSSKLLEAHKKSPVVRIGPNSLSYSDLAAIKDIYGHSTPCSKDVFYDTLAGTHHHLADVRDKIEHQRKRRVLASAYALKNLEAWEHKVTDKTSRLITVFDKLCTAPLEPGSSPTAEDLTVDYRSWTNFFTLDAIADIGLSERLGFLDAGNDLCIAERMDGSTYMINYRQCLHATARAQAGIVWAFSWFRFLTQLSKLIPSYRRRWKLNEGWNDIVYARAQNRLRRYRAGEKLEDFFQCLMEDKAGHPNRMDWGEIVAEVSIMMNAGSDTTAIAMNNVMFQLIKHPHVLAKLRKELDSVMDEDERVVSYEKVRHLPYLRACLDESLRLLPPTSFGLPRRTPPSGMPIAGTFVPGNTSVSISAYIAHRDAQVFPDPEDFVPERWLGESGKELQSAFISFSTGARGCIGRNISYLEQTVLLASVVHRYCFAFEREGWEPKRFETFNLSPGSMWLKVWRQDDEGERQRENSNA